MADRRRVSPLLAVAAMIASTMAALDAPLPRALPREDDPPPPPAPPLLGQPFGGAPPPRPRHYELPALPGKPERRMGLQPAGRRVVVESARPTAACPDDCGFECRLHGAMHRKRARRAARAKGGC